MSAKKTTTDTREVGTDLVAALERIRAFALATGPDLPEAVVDDIATVETFCAIALRVFAKTHPMKVRAAAVLVEIQSRIQPGVTKQ